MALVWRTCTSATERNGRSARSCWPATASRVPSVTRWRWMGTRCSSAHTAQTTTGAPSSHSCATACSGHYNKRLLASDRAAGDRFGQVGLALSGDVAIVGSHADDDNGMDSGSVYVFVRNGTMWTQQQKLLPSDGVAMDGFGVALALHESSGTVIVGAHADDDKGDASGSVYVFVRNDTKWVQQQKLMASDGAAGDRFGRSLALSGNTLFISSAFADVHGGDSGSVYVFVRDGSGWTEQQKLVARDGAAGDLFEYTLALSANTATISSYSDDDKGDNSGSVYVFGRSGTEWVELEKLVANDGAADDWFGRAVALEGQTAVVGAYRKGNYMGAVYIYELGLTQPPTAAPTSAPTSAPTAAPIIYSVAPTTVPPTIASTTAPTSAPTPSPTMIVAAPRAAGATAAAVGGTLALLCCATVAVGVLVLRRRHHGHDDAHLSDNPLRHRERRDDGDEGGDREAKRTGHSTSLASSKHVLAADEVQRDKVVGEGSFGKVYKGRWRHTTVAVKEVKEGALAEKARADLLSEAQRMADLRAHPNVVQFYGVCEEPLLVVLQYCNRGSLDVALYGGDEQRRINFSARRSLRLARDIASGLAHLHAEGIVHRDMAARNVLLHREEGGFVPKITDFGMARGGGHGGRASMEQQTAVLLGPLRWMAPEQMRDGRYSARSDAWSYAVVLYELYAREAPWRGKSNLEASHAVLNGEHLPAPGAAPHVIASVMRQCFKHVAKERPSMASIVERLDAPAGSNGSSPRRRSHRSPREKTPREKSSPRHDKGPNYNFMRAQQARAGGPPHDYGDAYTSPGVERQVAAGDIVIHGHVYVASPRQ